MFNNIFVRQPEIKNNVRFFLELQVKIVIFQQSVEGKERTWEAQNNGSTTGDPGESKRTEKAVSDRPQESPARWRVIVEICCLGLAGGVLGWLLRSALLSSWPAAPASITDSILIAFSLPFIIAGEATLSVYREHRRAATGKARQALLVGGALTLLIPLAILALVYVLDLLF